jgi:uncharacterized protein
MIDAIPGNPRRPGLAMSYEGHAPGLLERVLPLVDYLEVTPDTIARVDGDSVRLDPDAMAELAAIEHDVQILVHGVGLTIGSHDGWSDRYVRLLDAFLERIPAVWHSEHLGYTSVDGEHLGTMLPLPRTEEALELVCRRVEAIQQRYGLPFLLENVIHLLPDYPGAYSAAGFFNAIAANTGCGLLLDAYNLECDAQNQALDVAAYLAELDIGRVREVHVADGAEHRGFRLDIHSGRTREATLAIAQAAIDRAGGAVDVVTYELVGEAIPVLGHAAIVDELTRLRGLVCLH